MQCQVRNIQPLYSDIHIVDEFSFVRNKASKQKILPPKLQSRQNSGQFSSSDQTRSSQNKYRQSSQSIKSQRAQKQMFQLNKDFRQSTNDRKLCQQSHHLHFKPKSIAGSSNYQRSQVFNLSTLQQSGQKIYEDIIEVLQIENSNLKQQNQYFIQQHKRILNQNSDLKAQIGEMKNMNVIHIEIQKLKDINQAYQSQIEELKYILLQQIVAIHKKFNMFMSEEQASLIFNELNDSIKISTSRINTDRFTFIDKKTKRQERSPSTMTNSGMILADMLEISQNEKFQKSPEKTTESLEKQNILNLSNFDLKLMEIPTETTFSGHLRATN